MHAQTETHTGHRSHYSAFAVGPAAVLIWHERISVEGVAALSRVFAKLSESHCATGFGLLTIIENDADVSTSSEARNAMSKALTDHDRWMRAAAIAYEAAGFKATIVRSVVTAINLISRPRFPNRVFGNNREAVRWLGEQLGSRDLERHPQLQRYFRMPPAS